ncbi:hypothetical protein LJB91_02910 [Bacteroidales bacterium OttesenSCG-928-L03]|nr:hypothetical protein [Bacteroidales bacterium OttesenSCG-928-L03]
MRDTSWIKTIEELDQLSVSELETLAINASKIITRSSYTGENDFHNILAKRKLKLNQEFVFTPEYIEKFLWLDQEIKRYAGILKEKGEKMLEDLERMIKDEDSFFNDYEIEAIISPFIEEDDDDDYYNGIMWAIESFHDCELKFNIKHIEDSLYFEENYTDGKVGTNNWNTTIPKWRDLITEKPELAKYNIGYGMHEICDHSLWALQDIMQICDFHCDLRVEYQKYIS